MDTLQRWHGSWQHAWQSLKETLAGAESQCMLLKFRRPRNYMVGYVLYGICVSFPKILVLHPANFSPHNCRPSTNVEKRQSFSCEKNVNGIVNKCFFYQHHYFDSNLLSLRKCKSTLQFFSASALQLHWCWFERLK